MRTRLRKCAACAEYTLKDVCPHCGAKVSNPLPARFSPEDRFGEYRLRSKIQR